MAIKTAGKSFDQLAAELGSAYGQSTDVWYSPAETAALIRAHLKETFPGGKFKVQTDTYSGGASVRVYVEHLPIPFVFGAVQRACDAFTAGDFNGMIDLYEYRRTELNGRRCHYGASFVFVYTADGSLPGRDY